MQLDIAHPLPAACLLVMLLGACSHGNQQPAARAPSPLTSALRSVIAEPPVLSTQPETVSGIGRLEAVDEQRLAFFSAGVLRELRVDIGDRVRRGQLLARLDDSALLAAARQAQEEHERAARDVRRLEDLVARHLLPTQQLDDARTRQQVAEAALRSAQYPTRYARIEADADGVVLQRLAEPGEVVAAGQAVLVVGSSGRGWRLRVELADRDALRLQPGDLAEVKVDALPGQSIAAQVREIGGQASASSGALSVDVSLQAEALPLRSGLIARASVALQSGPRLQVPTSAVLSAQERNGELMLLRDGRTELRTVALGALRGDRVDVLDGLSADELVITQGAAWVDDGQRVQRLQP